MSSGAKVLLVAGTPRWFRVILFTKFANEVADWSGHPATLTVRVDTRLVVDIDAVATLVGAVE